MDKNMSPKTYLFIFFVLNAMCSGSTVFKSYYGIKTNEYPKSSCHRIGYIRSKGQCLGACVTTTDKIVMISHDESTKTCMCCNDITGSDITDPTWKSYVPRSFPWSDGCKTYNLSSQQICLKYFPVLARYLSARNLCQAEDGDLIKIDSKEKYDIFKDYHVPIANSETIQVWVQGKKVGGLWQFDDGTPIPDVCPIGMSNQPGEVHYRAYGSTSFNCADAPNSDLYNYTCAYHRF